MLAQNMQAAGKKTGKKKRSSEAEDVLAAGGQPIQIFAFWLVVVAAMAAWESKLATPSTSAMAQAKIAELAEVRDALEGRDSLVEAGALGELLPLLQLADVRSGVSGPAYRPPDSLAQLVAETLPKGEEDSLKVVRRLGCLSCQLQRHAFQAYNPLVQKATALYDVLQYGAPQPFVAPRTAPADAVPPEPNPTSNLIRLAYDADSLELPPRSSGERARAAAGLRGGRTPVNTNTHILQPGGVQNALHCKHSAGGAHTSPRGRHIDRVHAQPSSLCPGEYGIVPARSPSNFVRPLLLSPPLFRPVTNHFTAFTRRTSASRRGTRRSDRRGSPSRWPIPTTRRP